MNIANKLINVKNWDFEYYKSEIKKFVKAAHKANFKLLVFVDDTI